MPTTTSPLPSSTASLAPSSMQPIVRSRVLPRISFRALMLWTVMAALIAALARAAGDGATFAKAVVVAIAMLGLFFLLAGCAFVLAWLTARLVVGEFDNAREGNPFAQDQLPPQLLKPREPEQ